MQRSYYQWGWLVLFAMQCVFLDQLRIQYILTDFMLMLSTMPNIFYYILSIELLLFVLRSNKYSLLVLWTYFSYRESKRKKLLHRKFVDYPQDDVSFIAGHIFKNSNSWNFSKNLENSGIHCLNQSQIFH